LKNRSMPPPSLSSSSLVRGGVVCRGGVARLPARAHPRAHPARPARAHPRAQRARAQPRCRASSGSDSNDESSNFESDFSNYEIPRDKIKSLKKGSSYASSSTEDVYRAMKRQLRSAIEEESAKDRLLESVDEYVEGEKQRLMGLAEEAYAELDKLSRVSKNIANLEFDLALNEINDQTSSLIEQEREKREAEALAQLVAAEKQAEQLEAYELKLAARRQRGLFFKSLYSPPPPPKDAQNDTDSVKRSGVKPAPDHWRVRPTSLEEEMHSSDIDALYAAMLAQQQSFEGFKRALYATITAILILGMCLAMSEGLATSWPRFSLYAGLFGSVVLQTIIDFFGSTTDT